MTGELIALTLLAGIAAMPAAAAQPAAATQPATQVTISNFTFDPAVLKVMAGTTVTWVNQDDIPHTATSDAKLFSSPVLDTDDHFEFRFDQPGSYRYYCRLHPHMTGTVEVAPAGSG